MVLRYARLFQEHKAAAVERARGHRNEHRTASHLQGPAQGRDHFEDDCDMLEEYLLGSYEAKFKAKLRLVARVLVLQRTLPNSAVATNIALAETLNPEAKFC